MDLIEAAKTDENINELFYVLCRSNHLQHGKQGYLYICVDDVQAYINYIKSAGTCPKMSLSFESSDVIGYDSIKQYAIKVNSHEICVIDKIANRNMYFSKKEFSNDLFELPCVICKQTSFTQINDHGISDVHCTCCGKKCIIRCVYECMKCVSQYVHITDE